MKDTGKKDSNGNELEDYARGGWSSNLAHSKYGLNGKEIYVNNNSLVLTGYAGNGAYEAISDTDTYKYNTEKGIKASTTQNVYGIYDLSGGALERVEVYNKYENNSISYINSYGWDKIGVLPAIKGTLINGKTDVESTKYATMYKNSSESRASNSVISSVGKVGDTLKELSKGGKYVKIKENHYISK